MCVRGVCKCVCVSVQVCVCVLFSSDNGEQRPKRVQQERSKQPTTRVYVWGDGCVVCNVASSANTSLLLEFRTPILFPTPASSPPARTCRSPLLFLPTSFSSGTGGRSEAGGATHRG